MFQYSPLDSRKGEIRLVTLLPGKTGDAIRCTLSTACLDNAPKFTALSYVWGNPSETKPIILDGKPFAITVNLEAGLQVIRKRWRRSVLWIDAICINQKDDQEKNTQVPQMRRLYSEAPKALVWLGPSSPNSERFVSWAKAQVAKRRSTSTASYYWAWLDIRAAISGAGKQKRDLAVLQLLNGYFELQSLSYWTRMWTFQEYLLPRIEPMCRSGNTQPFSLTSVFGFGVTDPDGMLDDLSNLDEEARARLKKDDELVPIVDEALKRRVEKMEYSSSNLLRLPIMRNRTGLDELALLLYMTSDRQCFDERDKVFALYGMLPAVQAMYPPDYTKPITQVMLQSAAYIVNVENTSSQLWRRFELRNGRLSDASRLYPSWMPDFTRKDSSSGSERRKNIHVDRNGGAARPLTRPKIGPKRISVEHMTLLFWARNLGACRVAVRFSDTKSYVLKQVMELLQMDLTGDNVRKATRKPETFGSGLVRACFSPRIVSSIPAETIINAFYQFLNSEPSTPPSEASQNLWDDIESAAQDLTGKDLIITKDGCLGISVGGVTDGDIVVIPPDAKVPLVLTPDSSTLTCEVKYHKMVGTAIVDGVMEKGELFDEEYVEEISKRDEVEFYIH